MTRARTRKWLFVSLAVTAAIFILREPLGDIASSIIYDFINLDYSWARMAEGFFHRRWALAISALATVWLLYRYFASEDSN